MSCGIYKITNLVNNKVYIGQSINIEKRWANEKSNSKRKNGKKLSEAFTQYGIENFSFEILEECPQEKLNEKEKYYISFYNSVEDGYNTTLGGSTGKYRIDTEEHSKKIRKQYRILNKEKIKLKNKEWEIKHKKERLLYKKQYHLKNSEKEKQYRKENKEVFYKRTEEWKKNNKEKVLLTAKKNYKKHSKEKIEKSKNEYQKRMNSIYFNPFENKWCTFNQIKYFLTKKYGGYKNFKEFEPVFKPLTNFKVNVIFRENPIQASSPLAN